jgi:hypothetical protein
LGARFFDGILALPARGELKARKVRNLVPEAQCLAGKLGHGAVQIDFAKRFEFRLESVMRGLAPVQLVFESRAFCSAVVLLADNEVRKRRRSFLRCRRRRRGVELAGTMMKHDADAPDINQQR